VSVGHRRTMKFTRMSASGRSFGGTDRIVGPPLGWSGWNRRGQSFCSWSAAEPPASHSVEPLGSDLLSMVMTEAVTPSQRTRQSSDPKSIQRYLKSCRRTRRTVHAEAAEEAEVRLLFSAYSATPRE
jgi:hypothetical protein